MCTSVCGISSEVFFNLLKLHLHQEKIISPNLYTTCVVLVAGNHHFESLFCVRCVLCTSCCVGVTLSNTRADPGFVLYDKLNKATSLFHQSEINKTQVAYHFCFYLSLQNTRHFQRTSLNLYLPKMFQSKKLTTNSPRQTEFTMSRRLLVHNRDLKHDDAFITTRPPVLSIDKCCQVTSLSIEGTDHHVLLKASSCLRCLIGTLSMTTPSTRRGRQFSQLISVAK